MAVVSTEGERLTADLGTDALTDGETVCRNGLATLLLYCVGVGVQLQLQTP